MTTPETPMFDQGNSLLGEAPALLTTGLADTPLGQRLVLAIRTPSSTTTVLLAGPDAKKLAAQLTSAAAPMSSAGLLAASGNGKPA